MVRYFYAWTPLVIVFGTVILLSIPYLALIALMIVALVALAALAWAIASVTHILSWAVSRRWHGRRGMTRQTTAALHVHRHPHTSGAWRGIDYQTPQLARSANATALQQRDVS
jgi:hypothetical protein